MPFTIDDVRDLVRILEEKPEWRAELRRLMLSDDLAALREQIEESRLASERRIDRINEEIAELRAATERHTHSIRELSIDVSDLKAHRSERYRRTGASLLQPPHRARSYGRSVHGVGERPTECSHERFANFRFRVSRISEGHEVVSGGNAIVDGWRQTLASAGGLIRSRVRVMRQDQFTEVVVEQAVTDGVLSTNEASDLLHRRFGSERQAPEIPRTDHEPTHLVVDDIPLCRTVGANHQDAIPSRAACSRGSTVSVWRSGYHRSWPTVAGRGSPCRRNVVIRARGGSRVGVPGMEGQLPEDRTVSIGLFVALACGGRRFESNRTDHGRLRTSGHRALDDIPDLCSPISAALESSVPERHSARR